MTTVKLQYTYPGFYGEFLKGTDLDVTFEIQSEDDYAITEIVPTSEPAKSIWEARRDPKLGQVDISERLERERQLSILRDVEDHMKKIMYEHADFVAEAFEAAKKDVAQARAVEAYESREWDREMEGRGK